MIPMGTLPSRGAGVALAFDHIVEVTLKTARDYGFDAGGLRP